MTETLPQDMLVYRTGEGANALYAYALVTPGRAREAYDLLRLEVRDAGREFDADLVKYWFEGQELCSLAEGLARDADR